MNSTIESNLDSISITPRLQRRDLMYHVSTPECHIVRYPASNTLDGPSSAGLKALRDALLLYTTQHLMSTSLSSSSQGEINKFQRTLKKFHDKAEHVLDELGPWAADFFIHETIAFLRAQSSSTHHVQLDMEQTMVENLLTLFSNAGVEQACQQKNSDIPEVSAKVRCLLDYILRDDGCNLCGIVFVNQRVLASVLSSLLSNHALTKGRLRCVPSVGRSSYTGRKYNITELIDRQAQKLALLTFREGAANVIVTTSVLEEGIDVQACNMVACFDLPTNLKSYIQRRGRARQQHSRYGLLLEENADPGKVAKWRNLENELTLICQQERQKAEACRRIEDIDEAMHYRLEVESTGAVLGVDATLQHLRHFCQVLQRDPGVDPRPDFTFDEDEQGWVSASITLPPNIPAKVRQASSRQRWRTQKAAGKDAAFHAYEALFNAGFLNDHLLPLSQHWNVNEGLEDAAPPARVSIEAPIWWDRSNDGDKWYGIDVHIIPPASLYSSDESPVRLVFKTPQPLSTPATLKLHWSESTTFEVLFSKSSSCASPSLSDMSRMHSFTSALYRAARSNRHWQVHDELAALFQPSGDNPWDKSVGEHAASQHYGEQPQGLVRVVSRDDKPYLFHGWTRDHEIMCTRLPKRRNYIAVAEPITNAKQHGLQSHADDTLQRVEIFRAQECTLGAVPLPWARVGLFMPDIFQHIQDSTLAAGLMADLLRDADLPISREILAAITAPSAQRQRNYQRNEFLGDCVLKYVTSCYLFNAYPDWPEGYLSQRRSLLVCNATLASAAIRANIGRYIITEPVDYRHWTLPSKTGLQDLREVSSKLLADVVEALIGAVWLEAGLQSARRCINIFLPAMPTSFQSADSATPTQQPFSKHLQVEALIGYHFRDPALLAQALTHPSYAQLVRADSYERLEFLGDAVLDYVVTELLAEHVDQLSHGRMTQVKAALVNADLLGFLCFRLRRGESHRAISCAGLDASPTEYTEVLERSLADCMYFHPDMANLHRDSCIRYQEQHQTVQQQLDHGTSHPWDMLKDLRIHKMFSDMVESILGAIFLDSGQDHNACRSFARQLGLLQYGARVTDLQLDVVSRAPLTPLPLPPGTGGPHS
nr:dicer-like protein 2 [Quercus suber]